MKFHGVFSIIISIIVLRETSDFIYRILVVFYL